MTLVDPSPGRGASWAAAGMLAPVTEVAYGEQPLLALTLAGSARWPSFAAELEEASGRSPGYVECGTVVVARDADDRAALDDLLAFQRSLGLEAEWLRRRELRGIEPGLAPGVRGGILVAGDHQVDNRALVEALCVAFERAGGTVRRTAVAAVDVARDRVTGVRLSDGSRIAAGAVVLAAGCWTGGLGGLPPDVLPPVRPVKGQLLHLAARGDAAPPATRTIRGLDVYVVTRPDGRVVVGATVEEQGFDTTVTAEAVHDLLRDARELLPGLGELAFAEAVAGLRPGSPDNAPLIGAVAGIEGLVCATGHHRNGILLAPVTAGAVVDLLLGRGVPEVVAPFSPGRFRAAAPVAAGAR